MSVWLAIPSVRPVEQVEPFFKLWRERGYKLALVRQNEPVLADILIPTDTYLGYARSVNMLAVIIRAVDSKFEWLIAAGEDVEPVLDKLAQDIARECTENFKGTFGVMQPTGDRGGGGCIDNSSASAWIGKDFCRKMYGGRGPLCNNYSHYYVDTELQALAVEVGVHWQRPELTQKHDHWSWKHLPKLPPHLNEVKFNKGYELDTRMFSIRKQLGWPGSEPSD